VVSSFDSHDHGEENGQSCSEGNSVGRTAGREPPYCGGSAPLEALSQRDQKGQCATSREAVAEGEQGH